MKIDNHDYSKLVKQTAPKSSLLKDTVTAFLVGGAICALGEVMLYGYQYIGVTEETSKTLVSATLIALSVLLTGFGLYSKIAKRAGAGTLVPITGFANAMAAPAIEFNTEGFTTGVMAKMFTIAGSVIVCGITYTSLLGTIYFFLLQV